MSSVHPWRNAALALLLSASAALNATPAPAPPQDFATELEALAEQSDKLERPVAEQARLQTMLADPRFSRLPQTSQAYALAVAGANALKLEQSGEGRALLARACEIEPGNAFYWYLRSIAEQMDAQWDAAAISMTRRVGLEPTTANEIESAAIAPVLMNASPDGAARRALLQALFDAHWTFAGTDPSDQWYALAMLKYEAGERDSIAPVLERIRTPFGIVRLRADHRFDAWVDLQDKRWDVRRAAQNELDALRVRNLLDPDDMEVLVALTQSLVALKQSEEALRISGQVAEFVSEQQSQEPDGEGPYTHMDQYVWLLDQRAEALISVGRLDEALALRRELARMPEAGGGTNVSQVLNLAELLATMNRPAEALALLDQPGPKSPYGEMNVQLIRLVAAEQLHDHDAGTQAMDYLRAHRQDAPTRYLQALLYRDEIDEAASFVRDALASPARRGDMLYYVQRWPEDEKLPAYVPLQPRRRALLARADVQTAIDAVGRSETYDFAP